MNYIFEKGKLPSFITKPDGTTMSAEQYVKSKFLQMYKNNPNAIFNAKPALFDTYLYNGFPVDVNNISDFLNSIDIDHEIFSRIIIE